MVLFFSVRGEGKCEIDYKKKENFISGDKKGEKRKWFCFFP